MLSFCASNSHKLGTQKNCRVWSPDKDFFDKSGSLHDISRFFHANSKSFHGLSAVSPRPWGSCVFCQQKYVLQNNCPVYRGHESGMLNLEMPMSVSNQSRMLRCLWLTSGFEPMPVSTKQVFNWMILVAYTVYKRIHCSDIRTYVDLTNLGLDIENRGIVEVCILYIYLYVYIYNNK